MNEFFVQKLEGTEIFSEHPERYAFMRPDEFKNIYGHAMSGASPKEIGGYLAITNKNTGKTIYRKYRGCNSVEDNHVMLDYRTMRELQFSGNPEDGLLIVKKSTWCSYYFRNSDPGIKWPAWIAISGLVASILSLVLTIVSFFLPNC